MDPRPASRAHGVRDKYSSPCLSKVIVILFPLLPSPASVILLAQSVALLSRTSAAFSLLQMTAIVFVSFIRFAVSHFPKVPGIHFSVTLFLCFRKNIISGDSRNAFPKARRWHPLSPDLYSYRVFNCILFYFPFLKHLATPFLPDRKMHFVSHQFSFRRLFYSSGLQGLPRLFRAHWTLCLDSADCCYNFWHASLSSTAQPLHPAAFLNRSRHCVQDESSLPFN